MKKDPKHSAIKQCNEIAMRKVQTFSAAIKLSREKKAMEMLAASMDAKPKSDVLIGRDCCGSGRRRGKKRK